MLIVWAKNWNVITQGAVFEQTESESKDINVLLSETEDRKFHSALSIRGPMSFWKVH